LELLHEGLSARDLRPARASESDARGVRLDEQMAIAIETHGRNV